MSGIDEQGRYLIPCSCWESSGDVSRKYWTLRSKHDNLVWIAANESVERWNEDHDKKTANIHLRSGSNMDKSLSYFCNETTTFECQICGLKLPEVYREDMFSFMRKYWDERVGGL